MTFHGPTLIWIALVVLAASLASYGLSQWLSHRTNHRLGIGLALGVALLLTASVIVVVAGKAIFRIEFALMEEGGKQEAESPRVPADSQFRRSPYGASRIESTAMGSAHVSARGSAGPLDRSAMTRSFTSDQSAAAETQIRAPSASVPQTVQASSAPYEPVANTEPWAATRCVFAIQPDPADPLLWRLENECAAAVAILAASCDSSHPQCNSWTYPARPMLLPAKATRSVTYAEQAQRGRHLRYVACHLGTVLAIELANAGTMSTAARTQLDTASDDDGCLNRVASAVIAGRRSGSSIDALLGRGLPGRVLPEQ
jgi:hypothetical protein